MATGAVHVAGEELGLGEVEAGELAGTAVDDLLGGVGDEGDLLVAVVFAGDVHAVDDGADVVAEAGAVALHGGELIVEVLGEDPAVAHVEVDGVAAGGLGLALVDEHLGVVALLVDAVDVLDAGIGAGGQGQVDGHGVGLDGLDHALGDEGDDVGLVVELERGVLHGLEQRLEAVHGAGAGVDEGLDDVVEVGVADLVETDGALGGGARGR